MVGAQERFKWLLKRHIEHLKKDSSKCNNSPIVEKLFENLLKQNILIINKNKKNEYNSFKKCIKCENW